MSALQQAKKRANSTVSVKRVEETLIFSLYDHVEGKDGEVITDEFRFEIGKCSENVKKLAMFHGFEQRLRDKAALPCDKTTGKSASGKEKFEAIRELSEFYQTGTEQWNLRSGATGPRETDSALLLKQALGLVRADRTPEQIHEFVSKLTKVQISALLMKDEKIKSAVELIQLEVASANNVDAEELLSQF